MSKDEKNANVLHLEVECASDLDADDRRLQELGYVPSFKREFTNLATISFAFSIMGLCSSIATTFNTPLLLGGPASVVWCWILGSVMCFALAASIAEIVSAYPTSGGLYTASAQLVPSQYRARVGWVVGWLNMLGQVAGVSSVEFGLANMIWAAVVIARDGDYVVTQGMVVGLFAGMGLLVFHGILNSLATRPLARLTTGFVFVNLGVTFLIIICLLAKTPTAEIHPAKYVFGTDGLVNQTGGWNNGLAFLYGLLSVQWTMTDYDATAHISEEVRRAAYAAPSAIFIAVVGTGLIGWLLNIVLVLCSGPLGNLPGPSGNAFLTILASRLGKPGALFLWSFVCLVAFFCVQTELQATSRSFYAFSRDRGLPDRQMLTRISKRTQTPLYAVWFTTFICILPGLLDLASPIAANAIFSLCAIALDTSYIIPIFCRRWYSVRPHPEVVFKPGPFYLGNGLLGWIANTSCIVWTCFIVVIFSLPNYKPVTAQNMNYASVITGGVVILSGLWYVLGAHKHYKGPRSNVDDTRHSDITMYMKEGTD